jgi:hypothetical protein
MAIRSQEREQRSVVGSTISEERLMSTSGVSSASLNQLQQYFQTRHTDLQQLGQALTSGNLASAQTAYSKIVSLGQQAGGNPFYLAKREQDFQAIGTALQSGNLAGAQQAFGALKATFQKGGQIVPPPPPLPAQGPEIVLNLSPTSTASGASGTNASPEQITINISNPTGGGEKISIGIGSQGTNAEQVTLNLPSNSNEQIVLNLLGASSTTSGSSSSTSTNGSTPSGGLSVSA